MSSTAKIGTPTIHFHIPHWLDKLYHIDSFVYEPKQPSNKVVKIWLNVKDKRINEIKALNLHLPISWFNANGTFYVELEETLNDSSINKKFIFHFINYDGNSQNYYLLQELNKSDVISSYFFKGRGKLDSLNFVTLPKLKERENYYWLFSILALSFPLVNSNMSITAKRILNSLALLFGIFALIKRSELKKSAFQNITAIIGMLDGAINGTWGRGDETVKCEEKHTSIVGYAVHKQDFEKDYKNI